MKLLGDWSNSLLNGCIFNFYYNIDIYGFRAFRTNYFIYLQLHSNICECSCETTLSATERFLMYRSIDALKNV